MADVTVTESNVTVTVAAPGPQGPAGSSGGTVTSVTPQGDNGSGTAITSSGNIKVAGTAPISTTVVGDTITVTHDNASGSGTSTNYPGAITVNATGHVTGVGSTATPVLPTNNLSDLANAGTARSNLELGTAAVVDTGTGSSNVILGNDARLTNDRDPNDHSTDKLTSGTLGVARGGTGLTSVSTLLNSNQAYSDISGTPTLGTAAPLAVGISNTNVLQADANVADDDFLRVAGTKIEGRTAAETLSDIGAQAALTFGKSSGNSIKSEAALDTNDFLRVGTTHVVGRTNAEVLSDIGAAAAAHNQSATTITSGTLAVARGGTGVTSLPMVTIPGAADAAAARVVLGVTNVGSYTGQIETAADKTYTIDPGAATDRTISGFYIKSASGTVTATLKVGTAVVKAASVTDSTGDQTSLANTSVSANDVLTLVCSSNSSALDVIFAVEYTE